MVISTDVQQQDEDENEDDFDYDENHRYNYKSFMAASNQSGEHDENYQYLIAVFS